MYVDEVLADAPWGYWRFAEASGTTLADSSGNARHMTISGTAPTLNQPGPVVNGKAITWPAVASEARTTATTSGGPNATVEAWVYLTEQPTVDTVILGRVSDDKYLYFKNGFVRWDVYGSSGVALIAPQQLTLNEWHHIVASVGPAGMKLRIDKVTVAGHTMTSSYPTGRAVSVHGGVVSGGASLRIAEPAYYETQLSDARADAHFDAAIPRSIVQGESFAVAATMLDGATVTPLAVPGASFAVTTAMLDGATIAPTRLPGESYRLTATMLDGVVVGSQMAVAGESFATFATMRDGTPASGLVPVVAEVDTFNRANGRTRTGLAEAWVEYDLDTISEREPLRIMAQQMPTPNLVDGRPA